MKNLHKSPAAWLLMAAGLYGIGATFFQSHCSVTSGDLISLAMSIATFIGGYFQGKGNTPQGGTV